jgi:Ca-activated chloride channel homolog
MSWLGDFHFLRPWWLLALFALPLLWRALRQGDAGAEAWRGAVDAHLLEHLLVRGKGERGASPHWLIAAAWLLGCVALAGPAWERLPQPLYQNRAARVIAFELAPSMLAQDVKPSRVERARYKIADILRRSGDAQTALIAYAGDAFVVAPLTDDSNTVANLVDALEPSIMPATGNDTGRAIDLGVKLVHQAGLREGEVVLVADAPGNDAIAAATRARAAGVRVSVLGIGTMQGAPIAMGSGGFLKDSAGNISMPRLDATGLAALAAAGGGRYATYTSDASDLDKVLDDLRPRAAGETMAVTAQTPRFLDRGPWLLLALVPLAALGFRRGWLMLLPLLLFAHVPRAEAMSWADLWSRADQQAQAALEAGNAKEAQALAHDPQLRGSAAYRANDYAAAAQDFDRPDSADAQYNLGNALAKQSKYPEAIAAYDRALKQNPQLPDAAENRKAVEDWLKKQQQQRKQQDNDHHTGNNSDQNQQSSGGADESQQPQDDQDQQSGSNDEKSNQQNADQSGDRQSGEQQGKSQDGKQQNGEQGKSQSGGEDEDSQQSGKAQSSADDKAGKGQAKMQPESRAAEQQAQQQFQQSMDQALKNGAESKGSRPVRLGAQDAGTQNEKQQAVEQWLQRVPDDPGGLLRRKFQLEALRRQQGGEVSGDKP